MKTENQVSAFATTVRTKIVIYKAGRNLSYIFYPPQTLNKKSYATGIFMLFHYNQVTVIRQARLITHCVIAFNFHNNFS